MIGMTASTKPEEIYHAMLSSIAFGTRRMIEIYRENGVKINRFFAVGGIPLKNPLLMQVMADVLGEKITVSDGKQSGAKGSAIYASVAAGIYPNVKVAAQNMGDGTASVYLPDRDAHKKYSVIYEEYVALSEFFSKSDIMKRLRNK